MLTLVLSRSRTSVGLALATNTPPPTFVEHRVVRGHYTLQQNVGTRSPSDPVDLGDGVDVLWVAAVDASRRWPASSSLSLGGGSLQLPALLPAMQAPSSRNSSRLDW